MRKRTVLCLLALCLVLSGSNLYANVIEGELLVSLVVKKNAPELGRVLEHLKSIRDQGSATANTKIGIANLESLIRTGYQKSYPVSIVFETDETGKISKYRCEFFELTIDPFDPNFNTSNPTEIFNEKKVLVFDGSKKIEACYKVDNGKQTIYQNSSPHIFEEFIAIWNKYIHLKQSTEPVMEIHSQKIYRDANDIEYLSENNLLTVTSQNAHAKMVMHSTLNIPTHLESFIEGTDLFCHLVVDNAGLQPDPARFSIPVEPDARIINEE
jgi:hypothetical protein